MVKRSPKTELLEIWRRRRFAALAALAVALAAVAAVVLGLPAAYEASATVLVENARVPETLVRASMADEMNIRLRTTSQRVLSRARLAEIIERLDLYPELRRDGSMADAVKRMRKEIELKLEQAEADWGRAATVAFTLRYRGTDPDKVAEVANTLASFFVEESAATREREAAGTSELLDRQIVELKRRLEREEQRVGAYKDAHLGELPQQIGANLATLERLNALLDSNLDRQARLREPRERPRTPTGAPEADPDDLGGTLSLKQAELQRLRAAGMSELYPDVAQLTREIAALEARIAARPTAPSGAGEASPEPVPVFDIAAQLAELQREERELRSQISGYQSRVESAPRREQELQKLARDYESTKQLYHSMLERDEEAQLVGQLGEHRLGEQFRILDAAVVPRRPAAPDRPVLLLLGLLLAVGVAGAVVLGAEQLDDTFHSVDALREFTQVPVLASIPFVNTPVDRKRRRTRGFLRSAAVLCGIALVTILLLRFVGGNEELTLLLMR
jgi:polysaccharide chain length determinant protein (PEP-CTERM system associated)